MKVIVYIIGVFVVTAILYAIPILTICSFIYEWDGFLKTVLIGVSIIECLGLGCSIADKVSRKE